MVDVGAKGSQSDGGILQNSVFGKKLESDDLDLPEPIGLPQTNTILKLPFVFLGDAGFSMKKKPNEAICKVKC